MYTGNRSQKKWSRISWILVHLRTFSCIVSFQKIIYNLIPKSLTESRMFSHEHCDN